MEDRCKEKRGGRESAYHISRGRVHIILVNPEAPTKIKSAVTANGHVDQDSARRAEAHRELRNRESGNHESCVHKHYVIANAETPMRGLTEVMC